MNSSTPCATVKIVARRAFLPMMLIVAAGLFAAADALDIPDHRITFAFGPNPEDTLKIPYERNVRLMDSHPGYDRAVVMVHGSGRTVGSYFHTLELAAEEANAEDHSILLAPQFLNEEDLQGYTTNDSLLFWFNSTYYDSCWKSGGPSRSTPVHPRPHSLSSFACMDSILYRLASRNPDLETIVIAGHSAGGQFVNRYAAGNRMEQLIHVLYPDIEIRYIVANPSSYLYFTDERRVEDTLDEFETYSPPPCWSFNDYIYGLEDLNPYMYAVGVDSIRSQYSRRDVRYLLGELDFLPWPEDSAVDYTCGAELEGHNRLERGRIYYNYLVHLGYNYHGDNKFAIVPGVAHTGRGMYTSPCGIYQLFDFGECGSFSPVILSADPWAPRIQEVIYGMPGGTTILLEDGIFQGVGNREIDFAGKPISVRSLSGNPQACVIDCENATRGFRFHSGETADARVKDITIRNGQASESGGGISCYFESSPTIRGCIFEANNALEYGGGLYCAWSSDPTVVNCTFIDNGAGIHGGGIACGIYSHMSLLSTVIAHSTSNGAFWCSGGDRPAYLQCCNFYGNTGGDWEGVIADSLGADGNISLDPLFCDYPVDIRLCEDSPCLVAAGSCAPLIGAVGQGCDSCDTYACCKDGDCYEFDDADDCADLGGVWHTEWTSCDSANCPPAEGACCFDSLVCNVMTEADCIAAGGNYRGDNVPCSPYNPCPAVCCDYSGDEPECSLKSELECADLGGTWHADLEVCYPGTCELRACCDVDDQCELRIHHDCIELGGEWHADAEECTPGVCDDPPTAACCFSDGSCQQTTAASCQDQGGIWHEEWADCTGDPCLIGACCHEGECAPTIETECRGDWFFYVDCDTADCSEAVCCVGDACYIMTKYECSARGGAWYPELETCDGDPCIRAVCCDGADCSITREVDCDDAGGDWYAEQDVCLPNPCPAPCCIDGDCSLLAEAACTDSDGAWYPEWPDCGSPEQDPCPAVCCHGAGDCDWVAEHECDDYAGTWYAEGASCDPNPCLHVVAPDGAMPPGDYPTIQAAIDAVSNGEVIALLDGVFSVALHQGSEPEGIDFKGKQITIFSMSGRPSTCIIDGENARRCFNFHSGETSASVLRGVTIQRGRTAGQGGGILCHGAYPTIEECVLSQNQAYYGGGICCRGGALQARIDDCIFSGNMASYDGGAIYNDERAVPVISGCVFTGNSAQNGAGICCGPSDYPGGETTGCTFHGNVAYNSGAGVYCYANAFCWLHRVLIAFNDGGGAAGSSDAESAPQFSCTDIFGNIGGDWDGYIEDQLGVSQNIYEDPLLCDPPTDLRLDWFSPCAPEYSPCGALIGALGTGCGLGGGGDLSNGVFIVHHPPGLMYSEGEDWCLNYEDYALTGCGDQNTRIDATGGVSSVWYVLAAWNEGQQWCQTEFGLGNYDADLYQFQDYGPCFPGSGIATPTDNWPAPGEGVHLLATDAAWEGNFAPVYWFAGTNYYGNVGTIPIDIHPTSGFGGFGSCDYLPQQESAVRFGAMGLRMEGIFACPPPPASPAVCCADGECTIVTEEECTSIGGTWYEGGTSCDPNPCPAPCCVAGDCSLVDEAQCTSLGGIWYPGSSSCDPNPCPAVCCILGGYCAILLEEQCEQATGNWYSEWESCDPNPCPAVCCIADACVLVSEADCAGLGGIWFADGQSCVPNPCIDPIDWADHDINNCVLTVTDQGILGFMDGTQAEGSGFVYPADGENQLYIGSLWVGESESYVANRDFDADPEREWVVAADPDGHVWIDENGTSHQDIHTCYTDSAAASPRGLFVAQESWAYALNSVARDFVIVRYTIRNDGPAALNDLYVGCFMDFDISYPTIENTGGVDAEHDLVYITDSTNVHVGVRSLREEFDPAPLANLTLIHNPDYIWPQSYMLDADKYGFLSAGSGYVLTDPDTLSDYSLLASAGPIDLTPDEEQLIAFAIVGGESFEDLQLHAHVAQLVYFGGFVDVPQEPDEPIRMTCLGSTIPNPFTDETLVRFDLSRPVEVRLGVFDATGRLVRTLARGRHEAGRFAVLWDGRTDVGRTTPGGVYFLRLTAGEVHESRRIIRLR